MDRTFIRNQYLSLVKQVCLKQTFGKRCFPRPSDNLMDNISDILYRPTRKILNTTSLIRTCLSGRTLVEPPQSRWLVGLEKHMRGGRSQPSRNISPRCMLTECREGLKYKVCEAGKTLPAIEASFSPPNPPPQSLCTSAFQLVHPWCITYPKWAFPPSSL